jgi:hypothetical protein
MVEERKDLPLKRQVQVRVGMRPFVAGYSGLRDVFRRGAVPSVLSAIETMTWRPQSVQRVMRNDGSLTGRLDEARMIAGFGERVIFTRFLGWVKSWTGRYARLHTVSPVTTR